ncbi:MAG: GGDEF domain-containing protein [Caldilineaceae bacterium]|nr:GGDEF domain-containing protein [Caldilineaceae bacterium]
MYATIKFANWYRENRRAIHDLLLLTLCAGVTWFLVLATNLTEIFYHFSRIHQQWELDELVFTWTLVLSFYVMLFAVRRWMDAAAQLRLANTDSLTGVFNRRKAWELLDIELQVARHYHTAFSVILLDIDHFKTINDRYGHLAGDHALRRITQVIQSNLRETDKLVRWGGEEFVIIAPKTERAVAQRLAEQLRSSISLCCIEPIGYVTASFGVVQIEESWDLDTLLRRADKLLYAAKAAGRNRVMGMGPSMPAYWVVDTCAIPDGQVCQ